MPTLAAHPGPAHLIDSFTGPHAWASNFHPCHVRLDGVDYPSVEHAFNAAKTLDPAQRERVRSAPTPGEAKRLGRQVTLRPDWDTVARYTVMRSALASKYTDPDLRAALLSTGHALLVEGTTWHDQHWGDCVCPRHLPVPGRNQLGKDLMDLRAHLRGDAPSTWPRAAVTGHRPDAFDAAGTAWARAELERVTAKLTAQHATQVAISGMAQGADTWWAHSAVAGGMMLWAYVPFTDQAAGWDEPAARERDALLAVAARTLVLGQGYDVALFHHRNQYMVRDADVVVAVHDPAKTTGGTATTIVRAQTAGTPIIMIDVPGRRTWLRA